MAVSEFQNDTDPSLTRAGDRFKNLKRLFPSDQSMVAIIDDRADVWDWSPNLVKVIACESPVDKCFEHN